MFSRTVRSSISPSVLRFSGQNATPLAVAARGLRIVAVPPVDRELAGVGAVGTEDEAGDLRPPRPEQPRESDDLAADGARGRTVRSPSSSRSPWPRGQASSARATSRAARGFRLERLQRRELPPEHARHELDAAELRRLPLADEPAVPQHGHAVGDLVDLVEEVRDEDHGDPLARRAGASRRRAAPPRRGRGSRSARRGSARPPRCRSRGRSPPSAARRASGWTASADTSTWTSTRSSASVARRRIARHWMRPSRRGSRPMYMFSATERFGQRFTSWYTALMPAVLRLERVREVNRLVPSARSCPHRRASRR